MRFGWGSNEAELDRIGGFSTQVCSIEIGVHLFNILDDFLGWRQARRRRGREEQRQEPSQEDHGGVSQKYLVNGNDVTHSTISNCEREKLKQAAQLHNFADVAGAPPTNQNNADPSLAVRLSTQLGPCLPALLQSARNTCCIAGVNFIHPSCRQISSHFE